MPPKNLSELIPPLDKFVLYAITFYVAYTFLASCYKMLGGHNEIVRLFNSLGDRDLRYMIAALEGTGAVFILIPRTAVFGASLLILAMAGVLISNMPSLGGVPLHPILMLGFCILILVLHLSFHTRKLSERRT